VISLLWGWSASVVFVVQAHALPVLHHPQQLIPEVLSLHLAGGLQLEPPFGRDDHQAAADVPDLAAADVELCALLDYLLHRADLDPLLVVLVQRLPANVTAVLRKIHELIVGLVDVLRVFDH